MLNCPLCFEPRTPLLNAYLLHPKLPKLFVGTRRRRWVRRCGCEASILCTKCERISRILVQLSFRNGAGRPRDSAITVLASYNSSKVLPFHCVLPGSIATQ